MINNLVKRMNIGIYILVLLMLSIVLVTVLYTGTTIAVSTPTGPPLPSIIISPNSTILNVGESQTFIVSAFAPDENGDPSPVSGLEIDFTSSDTTIGTVYPPSATTDSGGNVTVMFTAFGVGNVLITAKNTSAVEHGGTNATTNATITVRQDTEHPIINNVILNNTSPNTGDPIIVTVNVTDNIEVIRVTADGTDLSKQGEYIWSGDIMTEEGTHNVHVVAFDTAGNNVTDDSASYTATTPQYDILVYYRGLGQYPDIVETNDLLKAADDWRDSTVPPGFSVSITTNQLLILADEWRNS